MHRIGRGIALALVVGLAAIAAPADHPGGTTNPSVVGIWDPPPVAGIRWARHGVAETAGIRWTRQPGPDRQTSLL